jgi:hypothetical protein
MTHTIKTCCKSSSSSWMTVDIQPLYQLTCLTHQLSKAIRFMSHDRIRQWPIEFQSTTPETAQNDEYFCTHRCLLKLCPIISASPIDARGLLPNAHMANEPMHFSRKIRKQEAPDWRTSLFVIVFTRAALRTKYKGLPIIVPPYF